MQPQEGVSFHEVAKEIDMVLSFPDTRDGFHQVYSRRNKGDEVSGGTRRIQRRESKRTIKEVEVYIVF